jgi:hypothetical protein
MARAREKVEFALRLLRAGLREHRMIPDAQLDGACPHVAPPSSRAVAAAPAMSRRLASGIALVFLRHVNAMARIARAPRGQRRVVIEMRLRCACYHGAP